MLPYPVLTFCLLIMWLLLNGFSFGQFVLGSFVAVFASWGLTYLRPERPKLRKWYLLPKLFAIVFYDIVVANIDVALVVLRGGRRLHKPGFVIVPLELRDHTAIALLAVVLTSTPGSAWLEYDSGQNSVLIHVLDLKDEQQWITTIKTRYERLLMEIFA